MNYDFVNTKWFNNHPNEWRKTRIKRICKFSPYYSDGKPKHSEKCTVIPMDLVSEYGTLSTTNIVEFSEVLSGLNLFENGDVLFAKITPCMENGKGTFVQTLPTRYAFGSTEFHVLRPTFEIDGKFLYFFTYNPVFRAWAEKNMHGAAGQQRVSARFLKYSFLSLPPLPEQKRIAAYLDESCASIDRAVENKQKQLETLNALRKSIIQKAVTHGLDPHVKMKESGVEWLGKIPEHWRFERMKDITGINTVVLGSKTPDDFEFRYLEISNVNYHGIISEDAIERIDFGDAPSRARRKMKLGDVAISSVRPNLQAIIHVNTQFEGELICSTGFNVVTPISKLSGRFLYYFVLSEVNRNYFESVAKGVGYPAIDNKDFAKTIIPLPPLEEQKQIAEFLDKKMKELRELRDNLSKQITTLTQYRKSLIHECVTGERRLRG